MSGWSRMRFNKLNEISKVAAIRATSALSRMLKFPIGVDVAPVETRSVDELNPMMKPGEKVVGLSVPIMEPLPGTCLMIFSEKSAYALCDALFRRQEGTTQKLSDEENSALTECANIVVGNFLSSFATPLQLETLMHRAPNVDQKEFSHYMKDVSPIISTKIKDDFAVEISFSFQHIKIQGLAIFFFGKNKISDLMRKVNVQ